MSHIFISYSHKDQEHLQIVLKLLQDARFTEHQIWYDSDIEAGSAWRNEITEALDSAFAVLVILTQNSVTRPFVIYEWAYAMGQGIPVIGLMFEDVLVDMLDPLQVTQIEKYHDTVPDKLPSHLWRKLRQLTSVAPEIGAINNKIYNYIYEFHRQFFVLKWIGKDINFMGEEDIRKIIGNFMEDASRILAQLEELILERRFALNGKQYRLCWELVEVLRQIKSIQIEYAEYLPEKFNDLFEDNWLPAFEYFESDNWWNRRIRKQFDYFLTSQSDELEHQMEIISEMTHCIPYFYARDAQIIIRHKLIDLRRSNTSSS
ncbi:MAG: toll/interleukin-1 receptor domain-containing protein [Chloroflexota bacterium]